MEEKSRNIIMEMVSMENGDNNYLTNQEEKIFAISKIGIIAIVAGMISYGILNGLKLL